LRRFFIPPPRLASAAKMCIRAWAERHVPKGNTTAAVKAESQHPLRFS
jgi:hypothetical protein